jgi:predicted phage terminase large subunit-like protein
MSESLSPLQRELAGTEFVQDQQFRREVAKTFDGFCQTYLSHYFPLEPADFVYELTEALEDNSQRLLEIVGFRGSAKSTFATTAYILYAALEHPDKYQFIIPITATGSTATAAMSAIKNELEGNELLNMDYGKIQFRKASDISPEPRLESNEDWQARNVLLPNGVRILARSRGQRIRGMRHYQHRPKLILGDDIEDLEAVTTQEKRDKTAKWWTGEVLPSLDEAHGRAILIGNWLHMDGLMARMKATGLYRLLEFPLIRDGDGPRVDRVTWKAKYPTEESIKQKEDELGPIGFAREMQLLVVPDEGQDVHEEDIHYYDDLPFDDGNIRSHGVDLAISTKESADYTAIVSGEVAWPDGQIDIYILPHPVNRRMTFHDTMECLEGIRASNKMTGDYFVENAMYQQAAVEELARRGFSVEGMRPIKDKRSRLRVAARYIKNGTVKFPRTGCEALIQQLLGFGVEKHDDLVDALVWLILGLASDLNQQDVGYV